MKRNGIQYERSEKRMFVTARDELLIFFAKEGFTVVDFAEKVGISRPTAYGVLKKKAIKTTTAKVICDTFGWDMMDYFELVLD